MSIPLDMSTMDSDRAINALHGCAGARTLMNEHTDRNTTAYIQNWISKLEEDNRLIIHAAANAQRAADCILGESFEAASQGAAESTELVEVAA